MSHQAARVDCEDGSLKNSIEVELQQNSSTSHSRYHPSLTESDGDDHNSQQLVSEFARRKQAGNSSSCFSRLTDNNAVKISYATAFVLLALAFTSSYTLFTFLNPVTSDCRCFTDSAHPQHPHHVPSDNKLIPIDLLGFEASSHSFSCPTCQQVCGNVNPFVAAMKAGESASIVYSPVQISPDSKRLTSTSTSFQGELNRVFNDRPSPFMRWEDPEAYERMRKHQGRWSQIDEQMFNVTAEPIRYDTEEKQTIMKFDPVNFRQLNIPILWSDSRELGDYHHAAHVHWNAAAEKRFIQLMRKQQFPEPPVDCTKQKYLILDQWGSGFFSRYNIAMEMLWRASNVMDRMVIIGFGPMGVKGASIQAASRDDFAGQGITQYFAPSSQCSDHPFVMKVLQLARAGPEGFADMTKKGYPALKEFSQIQPGGALFNHQFVHMCDNWCDSHPTDGVFSPYRRILFDPRLDPNNYDDSVWHDLKSHAIEHIYPCDGPECIVQPIAPAAYLASHRQRTQMWQEFYLIMVSGFYFQLSSRIHIMRNLVADFWTTQMLRKQNIYPTNENADVAYYAHGERQFTHHEETGTLALLDPNVKLHPLSNSAAIFVRRGDKCPDDEYCTRMGHFRGLGLFLYGIHMEEVRRGKQFDSIFVMSDDGQALETLLSEVNGEKIPITGPLDVFKITPRSSKEELESAIATRDDWTIAKAILKGRWVTHNVLAPASCFNPANREGFEGFLVSLSYIMTHASFVVGHESSNVFWTLGRMVFAMNQLNPKIKRTGEGAKVVDVVDYFY